MLYSVPACIRVEDDIQSGILSGSAHRLVQRHPTTEVEQVLNSEPVQPLSRWYVCSVHGAVVLSSYVELCMGVTHRNMARFMGLLDREL
jgi:hypothetical protein